MTLKKPSEYFRKEKQIISIDESVQNLEQSSELNTFSDAFQSFKNNLSKIEVLSDFSETLDNYKENIERINYLSEKIEDIKGEIQTLLKKEDLDRAMMSQLLLVEQISFDVQDKVKLINEKKIREIKSDVSDLTHSINEVIYNLNENIELENEFKEELNEKVTNLHLEIVRNETHIRVQNKNLQSIQESVKETLHQINFDEIEKQNYELGKKVKYLEEVFEKFNEKEILTETLIAEPSETNNSDPLTPLDQNFVTLDQLQDHYRLFINRIQQQLASLGGGGETRLEFLDDVDRNSVKQDGYVLQFSSTEGKFIGTSYVPGGGGNVAIAITSTAPTSPTAGNLWYDNDIGRTFLYYTDEDGSQWVDVAPSGTSSVGQNYWIQTNSGIHTTSNVGIGTTIPTAKLDVRGGDIRVGVNTSEGVILTSPNGTKYRLIVDNAGALSTILVP